MNFPIKTGVLVIICVPPIIIDSYFKHKCCCFDTDNLLRFTKLVNVYLNFIFFTVFLKNRNISSKIKRSKVTDYAALIRSTFNMWM